jgi:hypothetical protein
MEFDSESDRFCAFPEDEADILAVADLITDLAGQER